MPDASHSRNTSTLIAKKIGTDPPTMNVSGMLVAIGTKEWLDLVK